VTGCFGKICSRIRQFFTKKVAQTFKVPKIFTSCLFQSQKYQQQSDLETSEDFKVSYPEKKAFSGNIINFSHFLG